MKFTSTALFATVASLVAAAPEIGVPFGLITIRSGSPVQNSGISFAADNTAEINSANKNWFNGTFEADGKVSLGNGKYLTVSDNNLVFTSEGATFSTDDSDHLTYEGSSGFYAVADGNIYKIKTSGYDATDKDYGVALRVFYTSSSSGSSGASSSSASSSSASTGVAAVGATNTTVPQVNGAGQNAAVLGAAVVGVAGALLF
ncbi:hypothetical protein DV451_002506 [Geotrichum candidum]|uniref:Cell wall protein CWP1 n=1 Tax=Geotrichum candidum TaxID=1173061 RepID=A0A9P5G5R1_GEOCN|nr:hypothetical protein DV451_002506 [Geotrichum candidum]KAF5107803.1 hypothetical protein DV453_002830 [Geotrichum candidum]